MIRRSLLPLQKYLLDRMVLRPSRHSIEHPTQRRVMLPFGKQNLECFVQRNFDTDQRPELVVLKFPGTGGRAERSTGFPMSLMEGQRVEVWTWNPPGYGGSEGRASLNVIADAALTFWDQVQQRVGLGEVTTWLCGNSLGCATALHVAAEAKLNPSMTGLVLRNPPPLIPVVKRVARSYPLGVLMEPVIGTLCDSMNAMLTAPRVEAPAVFLQSALDSLVTPEDQNRLIALYGGPSRVVVMEGLEHACPPSDDHLARIAESIQWLWNQTGYESRVCNS
jgi:pimeloyl-ACP methyl ester carboxylesterase